MVHTEVDLRTWLVRHLAAILKVTPDQIDIDAPFADYGLDSMEAVSLVGALEDFTKRRLAATLAWDFPSIRRLASHLAREQ